ncbi:MAG: ATP-dependent 6-phosphofructokinase [Elusimicrobiota bacterium]|jgi:6-phosphofructokinase 1|nr:ATP-dependent 6-phosphofructokinase [Elusimicrobiota bacterium]
MKILNIPIKRLGKNGLESPLRNIDNSFIEDSDSVITKVHKEEIFNTIIKEELDFFEIAGPRENVYFDSNIICGIVTCGGLCPGINNVIRGIVIQLAKYYGVQNILGFRYGYRGLTPYSEFEPMILTPDNVDDIHTRGGTILSSSRGQQKLEDMLKTLMKYKIKILFTIGGDGTIRGASELAKYAISKKLDISIVAIPKTIDNDIYCIDKTFGFETAVQEASKIIQSAHEEAKGAPNGIGLVKLMGRESGYISAYTAIANSNVNYCIIPEKKLNLPFFLENLKNRMLKKRHAVIVVAEGAGQEFLWDNKNSIEKDISGNIKLRDIGSFLKSEIENYFYKEKVEVNIKYFDPSYSIRSVPANAMDSAYCLMLAQGAVHAGMAGMTDLLISYLNNHYVYIPIEMAIVQRKKVNPDGRLWHTVLGSTLQTNDIFLKN